VRIDAAEELRLLEYGQRLVLRERCVSAEPNQSVGVNLITRAVSGGGRALGVTAGIVVGASADIVSLATDAPSLPHQHSDALADSFMFGSGAMIDCVWRAGERVVERGRHRLRDSIVARYNAAMRVLMS